MYKLILTSALAIGAFTAPAYATLLEPTPYLSQANSPFDPALFTTFHLEDFEDGALNTPGLMATGPGICITGTACFVPPPGFIDSVGNGGDPNVGHSLFANGVIDISFDAGALGGLPTVAGLVWTDGNNPITFQAFDENGFSLGIIVRSHADGSFTGGTAEDRFYGVTNGSGISRLLISNPPGIEIDHIQYGLGAIPAIPEPATWAMMIGGFALAGSAVRRRRAFATRVFA